MDSTETVDKASVIFHERQVKEMCALHALNNLFQKKEFSRVELDQICFKLSPNNWINPHKSVLGMGNYDINVIMSALQKRDFEAIWFDKRRDPNTLALDKIMGFILNVPSDYKLGFVLLPFKRRHWIALKKIDGKFRNLDSKLEKPQVIGTNEELLEFLREQIDDKDKELFIVVTKDIDTTQGWLSSNNQNENHAEEETVTNGNVVDENINKPLR